MNIDIKAKKMLIASLILLLVLCVPRHAFAYLDPGAGSALIAVIVGGFTGLLVVIQAWKSKLFERLRKQKQRSLSENGNKETAKED